MLSSYLRSIQQEFLLNQLSEQQQQNLLEDLLSFEQTYAGGIQQYISNVRKLVDKNEITEQYSTVEVCTQLVLVVHCLDTHRRRCTGWKS